MNPMRAVVRPLAVLYACQGCPEHGQVARDAGAILDAAGVAEMVWLGTRADVKPKSRFPILSLDGCGEECARRWLEQRGARVDRSYILAGRGAEAARRGAEHIAAELGRMK